MRDYSGIITFNRKDKVNSIKLDIVYTCSSVPVSVLADTSQPNSYGATDIRFSMEKQWTPMNDLAGKLFDRKRLWENFDDFLVEKWWKFLFRENLIFGKNFGFGNF
jgi:hypothetical protein